MWGNGFKWKYRVRDCNEQSIALCETLEQAMKVAEIEADSFIGNLLEQGYSVSDGQRFKVDVRGKWYSNTWEI